MFLLCSNLILSLMVQALHEALMRQDDLLAYIDREEDEKYHRVTNHFSIFSLNKLEFCIKFILNVFLFVEK